MGLAAATAPARGPGSGEFQAKPAKAPPNILLIIADQLRWDCVGAYGLNPMNVTPNMDAIGRRGVVFSNAFTNQPWCSPSRACLFTGQYATRNGVWRLGPGLRPDATTIASELRSHGYTANYIGKWHLSPNSRARPETHGYVPPHFRGGFLDLWEAANQVERTTHPYEGTLWDAGGKPIRFEGVYRVDYLTQLAARFLRQKHEKPFFLVVSHLEPHEQNDMQRPVPPKEYAGKYVNPFVPQDLRFFPGMWQELLPDYYGAIKAVDDSVGVLLRTLADQHLLDNTIVVVLSDHANHFLTRTHSEWKCTAHDSSIHIPLLIQGPGFDLSRTSSDVVSIVDVAPALLDAAGVRIPASMQGRSFFPLLHSQEAQRAWRQEAFIQFSGSAIGRALRTPEWTYCAIDPGKSGQAAPNSDTYQEFQVYNLAADPHQLRNCLGRREAGNWGDFSRRTATDELRERLRRRIIEAGEGEPVIVQDVEGQISLPGKPNPVVTPPPYGLYP